MKRQNTLTKKVLSVVLAFAVVLCAMPFVGFVAAANTTSTSVADLKTIDNWKKWFPDDSNRYSGGIFIDKSVWTATEAKANDSYFKDIADRLSFGTDNFGNENFLVSLSAIGSNTEIIGYSSIPTDTMIMLDLSNSMTSQNTTAMVRSANIAIAELLKLNKHNRVGIVLYSGSNSTSSSSTASSATVILPLNRYTTSITEGSGANAYDVYLSYSSSEDTISVAASWTGRFNNRTQVGGVKVEGDSDYVNGSKSVQGGTYIQNGIYVAYQQFPSGKDTVIADGEIQAGVQRKPIMVLMTDGAPTTATTSYANVGTSNAGAGSASDSTATVGFLTQLTASWAKANLKTKYNGEEPMFYTLGVGTSNNAVATGILNPSSTANSAAGYWNSLLNNGSVSLTLPGAPGRNDYSATITPADNSVLTKDYVDEYWSASSTQDMTNAFNEIVDEIIIQSRYYATLVTGGDHATDGYISFTDELGGFMEVKDMKGIHIGQGTLVTGDMFARYMFNGEIRNTTTKVWTTLGTKLISAFMTRFDITESQAITLLETAVANGDIAYSNTTNFSNFVSWYADGNNDYLAPYSAIQRSVPQNAKYLVKSYIYLGDITQNHVETDMLYTLIRVREDLTTGVQIVDANLPAALLPMVTYTVEVDGSEFNESNIIGMNSNAADKAPACLLYEVGLKDEINPYNIEEKVAGYPENQDGTYSFYSNRWKKDANVAFTIPKADELPMGIYNHGLVGSTEAHFVPSVQNERYYYTTNTEVLYKDGSNYVAFTGDTKPQGDGYYHKYTWVDTSGATPVLKYNYNPISPKAASDAIKSGNGWVIPAGTPKRWFGEEVHGEAAHAHKEDTTITETLGWSLWPTSVHEVDGTAEGYHVFNYLGNNGKLTAIPEQGIKLTKTVAEAVSGAPNQFVFDIEVNVNASNPSFNFRLERADGQVVEGVIGATGEIATLSGSVITVTISDGDVIYIGGFPTGTDYTVTERYNKFYAATSANASGTVSDKTINEVNFVNSPRGYGSLLVSKDVVHPFGTDNIPMNLVNEDFNITVTFEGNEDALKNITATNGTNVITSADNGKTFNFILTDGEDVLFTGIEEGITYKVTEALENSAFGDDDYGYTLDPSSTGLEGTIAKDLHSHAAIINRYTFESVKNFVITVDGTKSVRETSTHKWDDETFEVVLEEIDINTGAVTNIDSAANISKTNAGYQMVLNENTFVFDTIGIHYFRIREVEPASPVAHMAYDKTEGLFWVEITDLNADGRLEINEVHAYQSTVAVDQSNAANGSWTVTKNFENIFESENVTIPVEKKIVKESNPNEEATGVSKANIMFGLFKDGNLVYSAITDADGIANIQFPVNATDYASPVVYTLKEVAPEIENAVVGITYNTSTEYTVTVWWNWVTGKPDWEITEAGQALLGRPVITNTYDDSVVSTPDIRFTGLKTLNQAGLRDNDEFRFDIYMTDADFLTAGHSIISSAVARKNAESIAFNPISFTETGTHYMVIKELNGGTVANGITYDDTEYHVMVDIDKAFEGNKAILVVSRLTVHRTGGSTVTVTEANGEYLYDETNFDNLYNIHGEQEVVLSGGKELTGRDMLAGEFTFVLYDEAGNEVMRTTNGANGGFTFAPLKYTTVGTRKYTLKELPASGGVTDPASGRIVANGVSYDPAEYIITVNITDNGVGGLDKSVAYSKAGNPVTELEFVNTYSAEDTSLTLSGVKSIANRYLNADDGFTFRLHKALDSSFKNLGALVAEVKMDAPANNSYVSNYAITLNYKFGDQGIHRYVLSELIPTGDKKGVNYDTREYHITIIVADNGKGDMVAAVESIVCPGIHASFTQTALNFANEYNTSPTEYTISGTKTFTDKNKANKTFNDGDFKIVLSNQSGVIETVDVKANGSFAFAPVELNYVGDHEFTLKEQNAGSTIKGVKYDDTEWKVVITVKDNGEGELVVDGVKYYAGQTGMTEIVFANTYSATDTDAIKISGNKALENKDLEANEYEFELYESNDKGEKLGSAISTVKNKADGTWTFEKELTFDDEKEYYYLVVEKQGNDGHVEYDKSEFLVKITVKDNGEGKYIIAKDIEYFKDSKPANGIAFKNVYTPDAAEYEIVTGEKKLSGRDLKDKEFTFELYSTDSAWAISGAPIQTVTNSKGKITFEKLSFDKAGDYYFAITEKDNGLERVTYDKRVYTLKITVENNNKGAFVVKSAVLALNGDEKTDIVFENLFTPKPLDVTKNITVAKTVKNLGSETIGPEGFEFVLENVTKVTRQSLKTDKDGAAKFTLTFNEDDIGNTYEYKLYEVNDGREYVTYSDVVRTVFAKVALNDKNEIVVEFTENNQEVKNTTFDFENSYNPPVKSPTTGDARGINLWLALFFVSSLGFGGFVAYEFKRARA